MIQGLRIRVDFTEFKVESIWNLPELQPRAFDVSTLSHLCPFATEVYSSRVYKIGPPELSSNLQDGNSACGLLFLSG